MLWVPLALAQGGLVWLALTKEDYHTWIPSYGYSEGFRSFVLDYYHWLMAGDTLALLGMSSVVWLLVPAHPRPAFCWGVLSILAWSALGFAVLISYGDNAIEWWTGRPFHWHHWL